MGSGQGLLVDTDALRPIGLDAVSGSPEPDARDWLIRHTSDERYIDNIFGELCRRLRAEGIPITRATLYFSNLHPQWVGARLLWLHDHAKVSVDTIPHGLLDSAEFVHSPMYELYNGSNEVRRHLNEPGKEYPLYDDLRKLGITDYLALPVLHTLGKRHTISFATDCPNGFSEAHIAYLKDLLPVIALVTEIRVKNIMARTLLETYVGPHASAEILAGATTRGSGATVSAAILVCDLRNFTALSDVWPRDKVIDLLNQFFDCLSDPIERHGGEILKFMGDGLLAIFPLSNPDAAQNLLAAIGKARAAIAELNSRNREAGQPELEYGLGIHAGDVMYGNIGSKRRLDFTVIGPAVNIASRLESLTKELKQPVLLSGDFVALAGSAAKVESLGQVHLRGMKAPIEVFAF